MITICLVAYSTEATDTLAFQSLMAFSDKTRQFINLIIFDNGKINYQDELACDSFYLFSYYFNEQQERGTRIAYQYALDSTKDQWLLLLDDDTIISESYVETVISEMLEKQESEVVGYVPIINSETGQQLSPTKSDNLETLNFPVSPGIYSDNLTGISSGLIVSTTFLREIGGFNARFPLDYLDHWLFFELFKKNKSVRVIDRIIVHQLSVMELSQVNDSRYQSIFYSEYQFYKHYRPELFGQLKLIYFKRIIKGMFFRKREFRWQILLKIVFDKERVISG